MIPCDSEPKYGQDRQFVVFEAGFNDIYEIWASKLWPNRTTQILPLSSMKRGGGYDMSIYLSNPKFLAVLDTSFKNERKIVAVNSFFRTDHDEYRSRGLWVDPDYRGQKIGTLIMSETIDRVSRSRPLSEEKILWTIPRQSAMPFYKSCGFVRTSGWFDEGVEFGPNAYAERILST